MNCPSCNTPLEPTARFCGVCGYRLQSNRPAAPAQPPNASQPRVQRSATPASGAAIRPSPYPLAQAQPQSPRPVAQGSALQAPKPNPLPQRPKPKLSKGDELYINTVLNN